MDPRVKDFVVEELRIERIDGPARILLNWSGSSRLEDGGATLLPYLRQVTEDAASAGVTVEVHIEGATFFNSSTIATLIRFIKGVLERHVAIKLSYDPRHRWQKLFAEALCIFDQRGELLSTRAIA